MYYVQFYKVEQYMLFNYVGYVMHIVQVRGGRGYANPNSPVFFYFRKVQTDLVFR